MLKFIPFSNIKIFKTTEKEVFAYQKENIKFAFYLFKKLWQICITTKTNRKEKKL